MPFTSLYADSKGSYHNFFPLVGVEFRIFMSSSIATTSTPVATKIKMWNVYIYIYIYCTKERVSDILDIIMYSNLIAYSSDRATFDWKRRYVKRISKWIQKGTFIPQGEKNFSVVYLQLYRYHT